MKPVTYKPNPDCEGGMEVHRYGNYVSEAEYNKLKKQVERLTKAGDLICRMAGNNQVINRHWNTFKKGVQS